MSENERLHGGGDLRIAVVLRPDLELGAIANTAAALAVGIGAVEPGVAGVGLKDTNGFSYTASADRPVVMLQSDDEGMQKLIERLADRPDGASVVLFPAFARRMHGFEEYENTVPTRDMSQEQIDGIAISGPGKWVRSLTGNLKLLR